MPELPEVETIRRTLAPRVTGDCLLDAQFYATLVVRGCPEQIAPRLRDRTVQALRRYGKFLAFEFDSGLFLSVHLGMTGKLLWDAQPGRHTRAQFFFTRGRLLYDDIRQFGRIEFSDSLPARIARLGPDPLSIGLAEFARLLRDRRGAVKPLLLNQRFLGGLGNIYADEALFRARVHPRTLASRLGAARVRRLHAAIRHVLSAAIESGGSSISDYVDAEGRRGGYQLKHQVYGKAGQPCPACSTPIRRTVIAQRGAHYCPKCQRA